MDLGADIERLRTLTGIKWTYFGDDVLPLWVADMDFLPAPVVTDALREVLDRGDLGYNFAARARLPEVWADWSQRRHGWRPETERVRVFDDVLQPISAALWTCTEPGDGIVLNTPIYPPFLELVEASGRRIVDCPLEDGTWLLDPDRLETSIDEGTRAILLCNPHNPTGRALGREELVAVAELAIARDLLVVSDEIWQDVVHPGATHVPFASLGDDVAERTVTVTAASKTFNLAGLHCAVAHMGHPVANERIEALPPHLLGGVNTLGAEATVAAWTEGEPWLERVMAHLTEQRDRLAARLAAEAPRIGFTPPEATYLAWLDFRELGLGDDPAQRIREEAGVALFDGPLFGPGGDGHARLNYATSRGILDEAVDRIVAMLP